MVLVEKVVNLVASNSTPVGLVCIAVTLIYLLKKIRGVLMITSDSPNPFAVDTRGPVEPLQKDHAIKDKVLKQGFTADKIPTDLDAIVIGSGMGGLTVASLLSRIGKKVLVLEQHDQAGGCCHIFRDKGFEFDVGIHYIGNMAGNTTSKVLVDQLTDGQLQWVRLDETFDTVVIGRESNRRQYPIKGGGWDVYKEALIESFPDEAAAIEKFVKMLRSAQRMTMTAGALKLIPKKACNFLINSGIFNLVSSFFTYANSSLQDVVDGLTDNEDLKVVMCYNFGDYGTRPSKTSFFMQALITGHFVRGAYFPIGGASEIAYHIIPTIERSGGRVLVRAPVTQILLDKEGKACGVRVKKTSGDVDIHAPLIVSGAGVYNTFQTLLPSKVLENKPIEKRHEGAKHGMAAMSLFVGLRGTKEELGLPAGQVWAFPDPDYERKLEEYESLNAEDAGKAEVPFLFITFPSAKDPSWSERYPGKSTCTLVSFAKWEWFSEWEAEKTSKRGEDYDKIKDEIGQRMWEQCLSSYPQLKDKVEYFNVGSPITNKYYIESMKGEIYGLDHNKERFGPRTWHTLRPKTDVPNLYLTGQDVMTCGFVGAMMGGVICTSSILRRNLMPDVFTLKKKIAKNK